VPWPASIAANASPSPSAWLVDDVYVDPMKRG
jgi:hypothetical protein